MPLTSKPSFSLRPLIPADVTTCADIAGHAFSTDRQTQFKAADPANPYDHAAGMQGGLEYWLGRPPGSMDLTVAVDDATQEIIGWVAWSFRGFGEATRQAGESIVLNVNGVRGNAPPPDPALFDKEKSAREQLDAYTSADLRTFMATLMPPGTRCMYVVSIAVPPDHQGKGVGTALIQEGTNRADVEDTCCWVHASEAGASMFERCGFEEIRRLDLDLDEWNWMGAIRHEDGNSGALTEEERSTWGKYVLRYMLRKPAPR